MEGLPTLDGVIVLLRVVLFVIKRRGPDITGECMVGRDIYGSLWDHE